jgi:hypothetical protein
MAWRWLPLDGPRTWHQEVVDAESAVRAGGMGEVYRARVAISGRLHGFVSWRWLAIDDPRTGFGHRGLRPTGPESIAARPENADRRHCFGDSRRKSQAFAKAVRPFAGSPVAIIVRRPSHIDRSDILRFTRPLRAPAPGGFDTLPYQLSHRDRPEPASLHRRRAARAGRDGRGL